MDNKVKEMKAIGLWVLALALLDIVKFALEGTIILIDGGIDYAKHNVSAELIPFVRIGLIVFAAIVLVMIAGELFLGFKGIAISKKPTASTAHITLAKVYLILGLIALIGSVAGFFENDVDLLAQINMTVVSVCDVAIMHYYIKTAKAIKA